MTAATTFNAVCDPTEIVCPQCFTAALEEWIVTELASRPAPTMPDRETLIGRLRNGLEDAWVEGNEPVSEEAIDTLAAYVMALLVEHDWRRS